MKKSFFTLLFLLNIFSARADMYAVYDIHVDVTAQNATIAREQGLNDAQEKAFYKNIDITEVVISEGISVIGDKAFYGCKNLFKITLPGTLKELGTDVFKECTSLRELIISEGQDCFYMWMIESCKTITDIYLPSSIDDLELEQKKNITVHVPAGSYAETYVKENDIKFVVN